MTKLRYAKTSANKEEQQEQQQQQQEQINTLLAEQQQRIKTQQQQQQQQQTTASKLANTNVAVTQYVVSILTLTFRLMVLWVFSCMLCHWNKLQNMKGVVGYVNADVKPAAAAAANTPISNKFYSLNANSNGWGFVSLLLKWYSSPSPFALNSNIGSVFTAYKDFLISTSLNSVSMINRWMDVCLYNIGGDDKEDSTLYILGRGFLFYFIMLPMIGIAGTIATSLFGIYHGFIGLFKNPTINILVSLFSFGFPVFIYIFAIILLVFTLPMYTCAVTIIGSLLCFGGQTINDNSQKIPSITTTLMETTKPRWRSLLRIWTLLCVYLAFYIPNFSITAWTTVITLAICFCILIPYYIDNHHTTPSVTPSNSNSVNDTSTHDAYSLTVNPSVSPNPNTTSTATSSIGRPSLNNTPRDNPDGATGVTSVVAPAPAPAPAPAAPDAVPGAGTGVAPGVTPGVTPVPDSNVTNIFETTDVYETKLL